MAQMAPKSRFGAGFFWGCLTPLLVIAALAIAAILFSYYYFERGYTDDPGIQTMMTALNENPLAQELLGGDIEIAGLQSAARSALAGHGLIETYTLGVKGRKSAGFLRGQLEGGDEDDLELESLKLLMPDGRIYDLKTPSTAIPPGSVSLPRSLQAA